MNDPIKGCDVYKNIGCVHVDGFLCDYPNCSILKDYKMNERIRELIDSITNYLMSGGLFNPELMEHEKVRDLLIECREMLYERTNSTT